MSLLRVVGKFSSKNVFGKKSINRINQYLPVMFESMKKAQANSFSGKLNVNEYAQRFFSTQLITHAAKHNR
jgi:hypothetical protein